MLKPQPTLLKKWRLFLLLISLVPAFLNALIFTPGEVDWLVASGIWLLLFLFFYQYYLPVRFRKLTFSVSGSRIVIYSGVFSTIVRSIPLDNVQFTSHIASPLDAIWGLCSLKVTAPGGRVVIPGLSSKDADNLAKMLTDRLADT